LQLFNQEQRQAYDDVMDSVINKKGKIIFLHSAGGYGKTFVCNTIAAAVCAQEKIALCAASSEIAALLLEGGRIAHSTFRIPIDIHEASGCKIPRGSEIHQLLEQTSLCIWDEIPMQHKYASDAVDGTIHDLLRQNNKTFGGITMLFGGDFRQTLPIIQRGSREQIIAASSRRSRLWQRTTVHHLHQNMRLDRTPENIAHAAWLLDIGAGRTVGEGETIEIPQQMLCHDNTMESLISNIYSGIEQGNHPDQYFLDKTILSCTNDHVDGINSTLLTSLPGAEQIFNSADTVSFKYQELNYYQPYPTEYLNSLRASGLPLSRLALKAGCPLMLLWNLDPSQGLCNGTQLILLEAREQVLRCRIISGDTKFAGNVVMISQITLEPSEDTMPLPLRRHQFPVQLAFAMTINKSQGQSVSQVGLDLQTPVFAHGQLYVALSQCTSGQRISVLLNENNVNRRTANIVYKKVLAGIVSKFGLLRRTATDINTIIDLDLDLDLEIEM
jgi:ATP-dependent DNA helicase PIF1